MSAVTTTATARPSVHQPFTKSYAIDQITDIEHLRAVTHRMWEAFSALHKQASHVYERGCAECNDYTDGEAESGCDQYHQWQRKVSDGFGSV